MTVRIFMQIPDSRAEKQLKVCRNAADSTPWLEFYHTISFPGLVYMVLAQGHGILSSNPHMLCYERRIRTQLSVVASERSAGASTRLIGHHAPWFRSYRSEPQSARRSDEQECMSFPPLLLFGGGE